jgi:hypothetical protein
VLRTLVRWAPSFGASPWQRDEGGQRSRAELNGVTCDGSPGFMVPARAEYCMRGADDADDEAIDTVNLGRLAGLRRCAGMGSRVG